MRKGNMNNYQPYFDLGQLIAKYLRDELTEQEKTQLDQWIETGIANRELFNKLTNEQSIADRLEQYSLPEKDEAWKKIVAQTGYSEKKNKKSTLKTILPYAASVVILLSLGVITSRLLTKKEASKLLANNHKTDLLPGSNKATLTLANGSKIDLDDSKNGTIANQADIIIAKSQTGQIEYSNASKTAATDQSVKSNLSAFNTIVTPRGGQYAVVLSDGTKVWLNAASSLKYPVAFTGNERSVELNGEAYFEVAKDATKPFFVKSNTQTVEVLGTHFNINSYTDEKATKTTLLEGSVKVSNPSNTAIIKLKPGQQAVNGAGQMHIIYDADVDEAMAWKNGKFLFNDTELQTIMRQLSRWYDVDVEYKGTITERHYRGKISRNVPVSQIFEILKTSGLNFIINGRKIIVTS